VRLLESCAAGVSRKVFLVGPYALKLPRFGFSRRNNWQAGLMGLLANMTERAWSGFDPRLCPVLFSLPGGILVVMRRARPLTEAEWASVGPDFARLGHDAALPIEVKRANLGVHDGRIVAVDYGGGTWGAEAPLQSTTLERSA
jgi:hypothetical protein